MDVVRSNFEDVLLNLPQIEKALQESEFVGKVYIYIIYRQVDLRISVEGIFVDENFECIKFY